MPTISLVLAVVIGTRLYLSERSFEQRYGRRRPGSLRGSPRRVGGRGRARRDPGPRPDPSASGWVTLDLPAGDYELVSNLAGQYAAGMYVELRVS